jgi:hypothetical protein
MSDVLAGSNTTGAMPSPKPIVPTSAESPQEVGFTWNSESVSKVLADKSLMGPRALGQESIRMGLDKFLGSAASTYIPHIPGILSVLCDFSWTHAVAQKFLRIDEEYF